MIVYLLTVLGIVLGIQIMLFLVAYRLKADRFVDVAYAATFIAAAAYGLFRHWGTFDWGKIVLFSMVMLWALRLGAFSLVRIWRVGRDERFAAMRGQFWAFGRFWVIQAVSIWIVLLPALIALALPTVACDALSVGGYMIWLCGMVIATVADWQKYRFKRTATNKDAWVDEGLWKYSRHPNYFGEILVWLGLYMFVLTSFTAVQGMAAALSPISITFLLLFVSGVAPLERIADARWGRNGAYRAYKARTSLLIILPPKG